MQAANVATYIAQETRMQPRKTLTSPPWNTEHGNILEIKIYFYFSFSAEQKDFPKIKFQQKSVLSVLSEQKVVKSLPSLRFQYAPYAAVPLGGAYRLSSYQNYEKLNLEHLQENARSSRFDLCSMGNGRHFELFIQIFIGFSKAVTISFHNH